MVRVSRKEKLPKYIISNTDQESSMDYAKFVKFLTLIKPGHIPQTDAFISLPRFISNDEPL